MPKPNPKRPHQKGVGVKLAGLTEYLTDVMVADTKANAWAKEQIANEGPEHKQVLNALLLNSLAELVKAIETKTGSSFTLQAGEQLVSVHHDEETTLPVKLPLQKKNTGHKTEILATIAEAPEHEALVYAMLLQVSAWGNKALAD